jgi:hypothetical protein
MGDAKKATFVKDVSRFFTGSAALYELTPPLLLPGMDWDENDVDNVTTHVVAADAKIGGMPVGVTLYRADDTGYVTSWDRVHPNSIVDTVQEALAAIGYVIEGEQG